MNRDIGCTIIDFSTRLAERQVEKDRQNEIRLRMKYGDFRYEIAEEVARKATIAFAEALERLDAYSKQAQAQGASKKLSISNMMKKVADLQDMASVAYADTPVKKR